MIRAERIPPTVLVLGGVASVQFGAAFAKTLFDEVGPGGTVLLRVAFAALILCALWRPSLRGRSAAHWRLILAYGFVLVAMNLSYYESLDRIPLGIAVTFEFVGPLGVAVAGSRHALDLVWVALAAAGILLLSDFGTADLDPVGVALALFGRRLLGGLHPARAPGSGGDAGRAAAGAGDGGRDAHARPVGVGQGGSELLSASGAGHRSGGGRAVVGDPLHARARGAAADAANVFGVLMSLEPAAAVARGLPRAGRGPRAA